MTTALSHMPSLVLLMDHSAAPGHMSNRGPVDVTTGQLWATCLAWSCWTGFFY